MLRSFSLPLNKPIFDETNHDTIGMVLIDERGNVSAGTSSNGARNKIPGFDGHCLPQNEPIPILNFSRVGDSPIVGAGAYLDNEIGGAAATGDGDVMMRFLPRQINLLLPPCLGNCDCSIFSFLVVELMRQGRTPKEATAEAIRRIMKFYPKFSGAVIGANIKGEHGAACAGMKTFGYSVVDQKIGGGKVRVEWINCEGEGNLQ
jgi:isoaspartyl peptidase/L-asparaginase-like protein (Ntn-hydrolase superfamily)